MKSMSDEIVSLATVQAAETRLRAAIEEQTARYLKLKHLIIKLSIANVAFAVGLFIGSKLL